MTIEPVPVSIVYENLAVLQLEKAPRAPFLIGDLAMAKLRNITGVDFSVHPGESLFKSGIKGVPQTIPKEIKSQGR